NVRVSASQRRAVSEQAAGRCEYCLCPLQFSPSPFSVEHIIPRARGGSNHPDNLSLSCHGCNNFKYTRTEGPDPEAGEVVALSHPRRDRLVDHFAWSSEGTMTIGISPTGRATVAALDLNREGVVALRQALVLIGAHPPSD